MRKSRALLAAVSCALVALRAPAPEVAAQVTVNGKSHLEAGVDKVKPGRLTYKEMLPGLT